MHYGRLAQLGEHLPYKQRVTGSSPVLSTIGNEENVAKARISGLEPFEAQIPKGI